MKTTKKVIIEKEIDVYKCDFCDYETEHPEGWSITQCDICKRHCCRHHREIYTEDPYSDKVDIITCLDCKPLMDMAWEWAQDNAGRYDDISEIAIQRFHEIKDECKYNS